MNKNGANALEYKHRVKGYAPEHKARVQAFTSFCMNNLYLLLLPSASVKE